MQKPPGGARLRRTLYLICLSFYFTSRGRDAVPIYQGHRAVQARNEWRDTHSAALAAQPYGDTEGVEEISPGLPDSERATPGLKSLNSPLSRVARRAKRVSQ
jgi:hypothetical protein